MDELEYFLSGASIGIPAEWDERMRDLFQPYLWYRDGKDADGQKIRHCWCSLCGGQFDVSKDSDELGREIFYGKHRTRTHCALCGTDLTMIADGRMSNCNTLAAKVRAVFAERIDRNEVRFRGFYLTINYNADDVQGDLIVTEDVRYILTPGEALMARKIPYTNSWETVIPREPWNLTSSYVPTYINHYVFANPDELCGSFLEYADVCRFGECVQPITGSGNMYDQPAYMRYLSAFCKYPVLEYLIKNECYGIISDLIYVWRKNGKYLNWQAKTIDKFCRMPKKDAIHWIRNGAPLGVREWMEAGTDYETAIELDEHYNYQSILNICRTRGGEGECVRAAKYLLRQRQNKIYADVHMLSDYWWACEYLVRDLTNERVRYPKNLREAHDEFTAAADRLREELRIADSKKAKKAYKNETLPLYKSLYGYYTAKYCAMVPEQLSDIALEGKNQRHCVGGYIDRHARGETIIIFIRDPMYPLIPRWTAEISPDGELRQVQGYNNRVENKPDAEATAFITEWLDIVRARVKKYKKEKMKESKGEKTA